MSFAHHEPDLAIVACVACGEPVDERDHVRDSLHFGSSCCFSHPYHSWCYRAAPPNPRSWLACADCHALLATTDVLAAARWLAGFDARLHAKRNPSSEGAATIARPPAVRFVRVRQRGAHEPRPVLIEPLFDGVDREWHARLGGHFEIVHASGCSDEPEIVRRLRASPGDVALRLAYAEELERAGDTERAEFVRHAATLRGELAQTREERLRNIRASLPSSWREAVVRRAH